VVTAEQETARDGPGPSKSVPLVVPSRPTPVVPPPDATAPPTRAPLGLPRAIPRDPSQPTVDERPEPLSLEDLFEAADLDPGLEPSEPLDLPASAILAGAPVAEDLAIDEVSGHVLLGTGVKPQRAISTAVVYRNPPDKPDFNDVTGPPPSKSVHVFDPGPSLLDQPIWTPPPMPQPRSRTKQWLLLLFLISVAAVLAVLALSRMYGQQFPKIGPKQWVFGALLAPTQPGRPESPAVSGRGPT
jgi:hypothetical protein